MELTKQMMEAIMEGLRNTQPSDNEMCAFELSDDLSDVIETIKNAQRNGDIISLSDKKAHITVSAIGALCEIVNRVVDKGEVTENEVIEILAAWETH